MSAPRRFHDAVVGFIGLSVEDTESRRFELMFRWALLSGMLAGDPGRKALFVFFIVKNTRKIRAHSERYINITAGIFEICTWFIF